MENFMRIAFWIFTLSVTLSDCHPTLPNIISDFNIKFMKKLACVSIFFPNILNIFSVLECIFIELNGTAAVECEDPEDRIGDGLTTLQRKIDTMTNDPAPSNPSACACERWPQKSFIEFLETYESLLQKENEAAARRFK
uniref:Interleukin n=1 Tax=Xiphophorus maculatus TaxID=8083 RepID=A0A3B5RDM4_XIPMA